MGRGQRRGRPSGGGGGGGAVRKELLATGDAFDLGEYIGAMRELVEMEKKEEEERTLSEKGGFVGSIAEVTAGLAGRHVVEVTRSPHEDSSSSSSSSAAVPGVPVRFSSGDTVVLCKRGGDLTTESGCKGVVRSADERSLTAVLNHFDDDLWDSQVVVLKTPNHVTYTRLQDVLTRLDRFESTPASRVVSCIFGQREPQFGDSRVDRRGLFNAHLNETQQEAIEFALSAKDLALVHGPPGTGKTTTVAEIVRQAASMGDRVLVCAPSNVAVDNVVEKLSVKAKKFRIVRIGHPARLLPSVLEHSLDALVERADGAKIVKEIRQDMSKTLQMIRRTRDRGERRSLRGEMRTLQREIKAREQRTIEEVIEHAQIVCTTITGAGDRYLRDLRFDLVVIDEAAQALEVACWIPILRGERLILAGDHCQLPPTVCSEAAARGGLERTLFDRLHDQYGQLVTRMLRIQYRMNTEIMDWSSEEFYDSALEAHESVADHLLCELPGVSETLETSVACMFVDTSGEGIADSGSEKESKYNEGEADLAATYVHKLFQAGLREHGMAIITPYSAQVEKLRSRLRERYPDLEIGTVDGFQGREKEAIIFCMVRSNEAGEVGFLADKRRTNVAITRARRHICIIGDSTTLSHDEFLGRMSDYFQEHGDYRTPADL